MPFVGAVGYIFASTSSCTVRSLRPLWMQICLLLIPDLWRSMIVWIVFSSELSTTQERQSVAVAMDSLLQIAKTHQWVWHCQCCRCGNMSLESWGSTQVNTSFTSQNSTKLMMIMHHTYIGMNLRLALNSQNLNSAKLERMYDVMCLLNGNLIILCNLVDLLVIY